MPLVRRLPKRGFHSPFRVEYQVVNVETLQKLSTDGKVTGGVVTPEILVKLGVVKGSAIPVKVLGTGEITVKLEVAAHAFSKSAVTKIETAGGKAQTISSTPKTNG
jgi:large subunit ribosomal protein L15